ncbi:MAG: phosphotransferase, partial [Polyangiaceae bacterium]|nr:phosphotransferase [Polyangiaceae bacterium]
MVAERGSPQRPSEARTRPSAEAAAQALLSGGGTDYSLRAIPAGGQNQLYRLRVGERVYSLRFPPETRRRHQLQFEVRLRCFLEARGFSLPPLVQLHGTYLPSERGLSFLLSEWIEGESLALPQALQFLPRALSLLRSFHCAMDEFDAPFRPVNESRTFRQALTGYENFLETRGRSKEARSLQQRVESWFAEEEQWSLPTGVVHGDPHPSNFLSVADGKIFLIDYDSTHVSYRLGDWVLLALGFYLEAKRPLNWTAWRAFAQQELGEVLTPAEQRALPTALSILLLKRVV